MKITRNILLLSASALLLLSCAKERLPRVLPGYEKSNVELKVSAQLPEGWMPMTKAASDIPDIDNAGLQTEGFGVYAFYTGDEEYSAAKDSTEYAKYGLVLNNRQFSYDGAKWNHEGAAEFWPTFPGENLSLFAYAPWGQWKDEVQYDGKVPSIVYDDYVAQNLSVSELEGQKDLLWGTNTSGNPHKNVEKDDYDPEGIVDFHFRHAVAKVHFNVKGTLPGEVRSQVTTGTTNTSEGTWGTEENGETTSEITLQTKVPQGYNGNNPRYYYARETETETESYVQTRYRTNTVTVTGAQYTTQGFRYLVEEATFKGFNKTGTLILDNSTAYYPTWTNVTRFGGTDPEYVLNSSNVLSQSLRYENDPGIVQSNFGTYTGIKEDVTDMMSGYFLYAIPRESTDGDRIAATIKYHRLNVDGNLTVNQKREVIEVQTRTVSRTRTRYRDSQTIRVDRSWDRNYYPSEDINDYTFTADFGSWSDWGSWTNSTWSSATEYSAGDWNITSETLTSATVNYNDDPAPELSGVVMTSLQGGREYDINLIVAGDKIELEVVPKPWELYDFDFDYNANINDVIQSLTYDSSFIDYADAAGNVYINNRMGKFYFKLGTGKYASWQASLVGDAAFGFTDENGEFLLDGGGNRVSSIRGAIDPSVMNFIYIKPVNTESEVTGRAKLRIYLIDATGDAVVALNLVNQLGVTEWTIVQNAN